MSRVLLTGAGGLIGTPLLQALERAGHDVHAVSRAPRHSEGAATWHSCDLLAQGSADELVASVRPELLVHLAWYAEHGRFWTSVENVRWVEATLGLMRAFARAGGRRAVVSGTCAEYEWTPEGGVLSEATTPLRPSSLYGTSKHAAREVLQAFADVAGFELAWGRIFFVYGPGEQATRLIPSVACALLAGSPANVTDGSRVLDFMHVDDVAGAFVQLLGSDVLGAINIASGVPVELRDVIALIGECSGRPELIRYGAVEDGRGEPRRLVGDATLLHEAVGFQPKIALAEGIARTVEWWRVNGQLVPLGH